MRKSFYLASAAIVATMLFSCAKVEEKSLSSEKGTLKVELTASTDTPATKVTIGAKDGTKYPVTWDAEGETVTMYEVTSGGNKTYHSAEEYTLGSGNKTAKFTFEVAAKEAESYDYYFFSPGAVVNSLTSGKFNVKLPASQKSGAASVDPASIILQATALAQPSQTATFNANFKMISAAVKMTLKNLPLAAGESVKSVSIQAKGKDFAATANLGTDGTFSHHDASTDKITVDVSELTTTGDFDVWFNCWPCKMEAGDELVITANTEKAIYTREISLTAAKEFKAGAVNEITVDMSSAEKPEIIDFKLTALKDIQASDVVVITMKLEDGEYYAMTNNNGTNTAPAAVSVTVTNNTISLTDSDADNILKWNITSSNGAYVINPDGDASKVLYATDTNNGARVGTKEDASWVLDAALDNKYLKYNTASFDRNLGVYNISDWRAYKKTSDGAAHANIAGQEICFFAHTDSRTPQNLSFPEASYTAELGGTFDAPSVEGVKTSVKYSSSNEAVATVNESTGAVTLVAAGTTTITAKAEASATYKAGTASYTLTVNTPGKTYASLAELVADGEPTAEGKNVTVTLTNEEITGIYLASGGKYRNGIFLKSGSQEVEIYCRDVPETWEVGGKVSGTLKDCVWKSYNSTWELCPNDWSELTYTALDPTCATPVITIDGSGKATITCATEGATIKYAIANTEPASFTNTYSSPVQLTDGQTIWAKASKSSYQDSKVASKKYTAGGSGETKTTKLTNETISKGSAASGYDEQSATDANGFVYKAYAIQNYHSKATSSQLHWQIKKYASNTAYYIQLPEFPGNIKTIKLTVSSSSQPMTGGGNTATLYFSSSNSTSATGAGVVSGTGASSITIDASSLNLKTGFITASGAIRIWDIEIEYYSN